MRKALAGRVPKVVSSDIEKNIIAPIGGLNSRDPIARMPPQDALILDNFICRPTSVDARKGQADFHTGFGAAEEVWALLPYRAAPNDQLFAGTDSGIYDVTTTGTVLGAPVYACTSGKWETINAANAGIRYMLGVNGVDTPFKYDGTTWSVAAITGVTPENLTSVTQWKFRNYFTEKDTLNIWYLAVNAVQGAATKFDLAPIFRKGGSVLAIGTWTIDGGNGADDFIVFLTTEGEAAVYSGTDPASATTFALVGVYDLPRPIGRKCLFKYGGDLLVITEAGILRMSKMLQSATIDRVTSLSDKVVGGISYYTSLYKANFGWSLTQYSAEQILILNVPIIEGGQSVQFVMNTLTESWTMFKSMHAFCMLEFGARLFYGTTAKVVQALTTNSDFGANITLLAKQAYTTFGYPLKVKQVKLLRQNFITANPLTIALAIRVNYEDNNYLSSGTSSSNAIAIWDVSVWDAVVWAGGNFVVADWRSVAHKPGYALCLLMQITAKDLVFSWNHTDYLLGVGSAL